MQPKFLHVGCGFKRKPDTPFSDKDWQEIRFDIDKSVQPDLVGTMTDMNTVQDASMDAIYSSHNIEHLYAHEIPVALKEFKRTLKPNGFALITCPDLQTICEVVANDKLIEPLYVSPTGPIAAIDIIYGHRAAIQRGEFYMAHRYGFTATSLLGTLNQQGFSAIVIRRPQHIDLWAIASTSEDQELLQEKAQEFLPQ